MKVKCSKVAEVKTVKVTSATIEFSRNELEMLVAALQDSMNTDPVGETEDLLYELLRVLQTQEL